MDPSLGWIGPYRLERELGRGAMGAVYLALDPQRKTKVAVKVLAEGFAEQVDRARFQREVEALSRVGTHPGVVGLASAGALPDGRPYLAMEYVQGENLEQLLKRGLSSERVASYALQLASALGFAHELGLIHRDVKPANVLVEASGERALLADFGLASVEESRGEGRLTRTGEAVGTPAYMAPEQFHPAEYGEPGPHTDVYALGALVYFALTGRSANGEGSTIMLMANLASGVRPAPLATLAKDDLARRLGPVVDKALSLQPTERYPSASALSVALQEAISGEPAPPTPRALVAILALLIAAALVLSVGAGILYVSRDDVETQASPVPSDRGGLEPALRAFEAGDTLRARRLLGAAGEGSAAAEILIAAGEPRRALEAAGPQGGDLDPWDWARAARAVDDREARLRALTRLQPGPASYLAIELGSVEEPEDPEASPDWAILVLAGRAFAKGDLASALVEGYRLGERSGLEPRLDAETASLVFQSHLGRGDLPAAARAWLRWKPEGKLGAARRASWASLLLACSHAVGDPITDSALTSAAADAARRAPGLAPTRDAEAIRQGAPLPEGRARALLLHALQRGERWLALAELGLDPEGARRSLPLLKLGRLAARPRAALAIARAERLGGDLPRARAALEEAAPGEQRLLLEAQFMAQGLDSLGLEADLARVRSSSLGHTELSRGWQAVVDHLGAEAPESPRLRLAWGAAVAEKLEAERLEAAGVEAAGAGAEAGRERREALREIALRALRPLSGDPGPVARARAALGAAGVDLEASWAGAEEACEALALEAEALLAGPIPPAIRLEALRVTALLGERLAAEAYLALVADLPAQAWLEVSSADYAAPPEARASRLASALRLRRGRLAEAQLGRGPPVELGLALLALGEQSVQRFASTRESLEQLAQTLAEFPDSTPSVLALLAWDPQKANAPEWAPESSLSWLAYALRELVGDRPSRAQLRSAVVACGESLRLSKVPLPGAHLVRALCLGGLDRQALAQGDVAAARAGIPWSFAPWRCALSLEPSSRVVLDELMSRGGLRLRRPSFGARGLLRFEERAREGLAARVTQIYQDRAWGPRMSAAIMIRRVDDTSASLPAVQSALAGISDARVRRGAYASVLHELRDNRKGQSSLAEREASWRAIWARPLGGARCGQALVLELRDRIPHARPPLSGNLVTEKGERELRDARPGSSERRYWRECDLRGRVGVGRIAARRKGPVFTPESLRDPDDVARAFLECPWDTQLNRNFLDHALVTGAWAEASLTLRRLTSFSSVERPGSALAYNAHKRVLPRGLSLQDPERRAKTLAVLGGAIRDGLRIARRGSDLSRVRALEVEVALERAHGVQGEARETWLSVAEIAHRGARSNDIRATRRFYAYWRGARVALLRRGPLVSLLAEAEQEFMDARSEFRRRVLESLANDPWRETLEANEVYRTWADALRSAGEGSR